jgi:hypothetical protein
MPQRRAEHQREHHQRQHLAVERADRGIERVAWNQLDQDVGQRPRGRRVGAQLLDRRSGAEQCVELQAFAGPNRVDQRQPDHDRGRTEQRGVAERASGDAGEPLAPAQLVDADDQRREHHRHDDHEDGAQEHLAERPEDVGRRGGNPRRRGVGMQQRPGDAAEDQRDEQPGVQLH